MKIELVIGIAFIVGLTFGFCVGFGYGAKAAFYECVDIGLNFVDIDVNEDLIKQAVFNYKNNINSCFNNAPIFNDSGY